MYKEKTTNRQTGLPAPRTAPPQHTIQNWLHLLPSPLLPIPSLLLHDVNTDDGYDNRDRKEKDDCSYSPPATLTELRSQQRVVVSQESSFQAGCMIEASQVTESSVPSGGMVFPPQCSIIAPHTIYIPKRKENAVASSHYAENTPLPGA
ncbi:hypothetical protein E2C01_081225 [Portunus trituberculatus]|uniref:Uncharacterized protein n=1 Tax=Portunus trituberculatus TaxID=210409 RepID=A0A5B7IW24_PORTR|nr:hypothetical protein [Portunus trituberculatus]